MQVSPVQQKEDIFIEIGVDLRVGEYAEPAGSAAPSLGDVDKDDDGAAGAPVGAGGTSSQPSKVSLEATICS